MAGLPNVTPRATPTPTLGNPTIPALVPDPDGAVSVPVPTAASTGALGSAIIGPRADALLQSAQGNFDKGNYGTAVGNFVGAAGLGTVNAIGGPIANTAVAAGRGIGVIGQGLINAARGVVGMDPLVRPASADAVAPGVAAVPGQGLGGQAAINYFNSPAAATARAAIPAAAVVPGNALQAGVISRGIQPYVPLSTDAPVAAPAPRGGGLPSPSAKPGTDAYHGNVISLATGQTVDPSTINSPGVTTNGARMGSGGGDIKMAQLPQYLSLLEASNKELAGRTLDSMQEADFANAAARRPGETQVVFDARQATARALRMQQLIQRTGGVQNQLLGQAIQPVEAK